MCWNSIRKRIQNLVDQNEPRKIVSECVHELQSLSKPDQVNKDALIDVHANTIYVKIELHEIIQQVMWLIHIDPKPQIDQLMYQQMNFSEYEFSLKDSTLLYGFPKLLYEEFVDAFCKEERISWHSMLDEIKGIDQKMKKSNENEKIVYEYVNDSMNLLNMIFVAKRFLFLIDCREK